VGVCFSNALQPLDLIQHKFVELLGFSNFHHGEYVAGAPTGIGHLDSRQARNLPRHVARLASFHCNDDVSSHSSIRKAMRLFALLTTVTGARLEGALRGTASDEAFALECAGLRSNSFISFDHGRDTETLGS